MRILHVIMTFHPNSSAGGPTYGLYALSQGLIERGHQVSVCCSDRLDLKRRVDVDEWDHGVNSPVLWDGVEVTYVRSFHPGYGGYGTVVSFALWPYLNKEIEKYDVVHIHGTWNMLNAIAVLAANLHKVPYVVQLWNTFRIRLHRIVLKRVFHLLLRTPWLNHASAIIALTPDEQKEYLLSRPQDRGKVFIIPTVMPQIHRPAKGGFRRRWGISPHDCLVLYLGRLHSGKGIEHLIRSMRLLRRDNVRLVVVGPDTGHGAALEELAERLRLTDQVLFAGPIYGDAKYLAFRDADLFVLPSMFEQLPVSSLEAALCEVPLILSDRCGMTEMVMEAEAGIIVPYGSPQALAEAIDRLCDDPDLRSHMGRNARAMVQRYCDPDRVIKSLEEVYRKACS